jgi:hypothetical protein
MIAVPEDPFPASGKGISGLQGKVVDNGVECLVTGTITLLLFLSLAAILEYRLSQP